MRWLCSMLCVTVDKFLVSRLADPSSLAFSHADMCLSACSSGVYYFALDEIVSIFFPPGKYTSLLFSF